MKITQKIARLLFAVSLSSNLFGMGDAKELPSALLTQCFLNLDVATLLNVFPVSCTWNVAAKNAEWQVKAQDALGSSVTKPEGFTWKQLVRNPTFYVLKMGTWEKAKVIDTTSPEIFAWLDKRLLEILGGVVIDKMKDRIVDEKDLMAVLLAYTSLYVNAPWAAAKEMAQVVINTKLLRYSAISALYKWDRAWEASVMAFQARPKSVWETAHNRIKANVEREAQIFLAEPFQDLITNAVNTLGEEIELSAKYDAALKLSALYELASMASDHYSSEFLLKGFLEAQAELEQQKFYMPVDEILALVPNLDENPHTATFRTIAETLASRVRETACSEH